MTAAPTLSRVPRVLVADDHPAMLKTVTGMLSPHFDVVAAMSDGQAALDAAVLTSPDLVLSDIIMPGLDGFRTARALKKQNSPAKVVFLSAQEDEDYVSQALAVGAMGYVVKRRMRTDLVRALHLALADQYFVSPHAFVGTQKYTKTGHILTFYLDEKVFFQRVSESAFSALAKGERVFMFLTKAGLNLVTKQLRAAGTDLVAAMSQKKCVALNVEKVIPLLIRHGSPNPAFFEAFFGPALGRAAADARAEGSRVMVFSDMTAALLRQGYNHPVAVKVEEIFDDMVARHPCIIYCGCPLTHLSSKEIRETLSRVCGQHGNVISIDK